MKIKNFNKFFLKYYFKYQNNKYLKTIFLKNLNILISYKVELFINYLKLQQLNLYYIFTKKIDAI
jgi:hypothetical protein